jgi:ATP/maltotriose-dependent transcriptional regulator MalT
MLKAERQPPTDVLFATLNNEIALLPERFVLVLDDYHTIQGDAVNDFLNALVRHWPRILTEGARLSDKTRCAPEALRLAAACG